MSFDIREFNIIQDVENYYFFRALNMADNNDIEQEITTSEDGKIERIRTDRERFEGKTKYNENSEISLEEIYDHIKMHYRKDTNCISLTTNGNIAVNYGRSSYKDKYIMVKIPKKEFGEKTVFAGQYMLQELNSRIQNAVENLQEEKKQEVLSIFKDIEESAENKTLQDIISRKYISKTGEIPIRRAHLRKDVTYSSPNATITSYQALDDEQQLEVNKIYAKLAILESKNILRHVISHSSNSKLRGTIGNAFSSTEVIHYGEIEKENIIEIPKEIVDIFALVQQIDAIDKSRIEELKQALVLKIQDLKQIIPIPDITYQVRDNILIEEMYELTDGKVEYGKANSIVNNMFYLSKSRKNAIELSNILEESLGENSEFEDLIQYIKENGFRVEPEIVSRQSGKGVKLSESVNLNLIKEEQSLVDEIKKLSSDELDIVLQNGGLYNTNDIISRIYGNVRESNRIDKSRYYAEAIISRYNWKDIGIEEFKITERNDLISRLQQRNCIELYEKLRESGIEEKQIPTILLNIAMRDGFYEEYEKGNLEQILNIGQDVLQDNINIELVERFLGYHNVENTQIRLKDYQRRAYDNINEIFDNKKFAQVILPTGAGKSFVALAQMQKYAQEHPNEKMLYLAPQEEILDQIKKYIVKYVHGKKETVGKTEDKIIKEVFPNITFETYIGLLAKRGEKEIKDQYGMIILDELHRTGAKEWERKIDILLENQTDDVKVLGITATPTRDVDRRDMSNEIAEKLGYIKEEIEERKHIASNMTLENAIRMGYVVNPKIIYCNYDLISSGKMNQLREKINQIEDETKRLEELRKYNKLLEKLNKEINDEIQEQGRKKIEEEARKNLDSGIGKDIILIQNVKKGGKYIVFIPVSNQEDIEDESGNRIGTKTGEEKIKSYQEYLNKIFEETDIEPEIYSLLGSYTKNKNKEEIDNFESDSSDKTKFMLVMNKANEGLHIDGIDGIIWFRALDENSKILYLQQLGRAIYALDEDNPLPDEKRPIIIDLANNSLTVKIEKDFKSAQPVNDLEAITIVIEWINNHSGMIPDRNSSSKKEQHYYAVLRRIQNKYSKYLNGFENFESLEDEDISRIEEIIDLACEIDLWNMELPPIPKTRGYKEEFEPFTTQGVLRDFVELEEDVDKSIIRGKLLQNALEIENWCKRENEGKEIWDKRLPSKTSKDEDEKRLGSALINIRTKLKQYEEKKIVNEEYKKLQEIIRRIYEEYGLSIALKNALEIENWCKIKFEGKEKWERRLPSTKSKNEEEKRLGNSLGKIRAKLKQYEGKDIEDIENNEDRKVLAIIRKLDEEYGLSVLFKNALEIENWCKRENEGKKKWEKRLPSTVSKDKEEKRLGFALIAIKVQLKQYEGKEIENEEDRKLEEIIRRLDEEYGLSIAFKNALEIENWCKIKFEGKEKWERRLPSTKSKNEEEKRLGCALAAINVKLKRYEGKENENEEDRKLQEIIKRLYEEYGLSIQLKNALEIENWCKRKFEGKEKCERKLPNRRSKDEEEKRLGEALMSIRKKMKQYEGKDIEDIENNEDRKVLAIIRKLDEEYNPKKAKQEKLQKVKQERDNAKEKNKKARYLEQQVSEKLKKRGKLHEEQ